MQTNHSAAPWTAHDDDGTGTLPCVLSDKVTSFGNFYIAQCNVYADARLIAAAPDLLAALEALVGEADLGEVDLEPEEMAKLEAGRAAIAKARGK